MRAKSATIVEFIPKERENGVLFVSIAYATAVTTAFAHAGVTPISPLGGSSASTARR